MSFGISPFGVRPQASECGAISHSSAKTGSDPVSVARHRHQSVVRRCPQLSPSRPPGVKPASLLGCSAVFRTGTQNGTPKTLATTRPTPALFRLFRLFHRNTYPPTYAPACACACACAYARTRIGLSLGDSAEQRNKRNGPSRCKGFQRSALFRVFRSTGTNSAVGQRQRRGAGGGAHSPEPNLPRLLRPRQPPEHRCPAVRPGGVLQDPADPQRAV